MSEQPVYCDGFANRGCRQSPTNVYHALAARIADLVTTKQQQYGDAFGVAPQILALLYPDGVRVEQYDDLLAVVRILDKLKRIATDKQGDGENPAQDIAGYALLMLAQRERG
jgi:hypothetical protein